MLEREDELRHNRVCIKHSHEMPKDDALTSDNLIRESVSSCLGIRQTVKPGN